MGDKIVYYRNSKNMGHAVSVNIGVKIARGKWIKLLDDDDYLALNCKQVPFGTPVQIAFRGDAIRFGL